MGNPATVAGGLRQPEQVQKAVCAYGLHATYKSFRLFAERVGITFSGFSLGLAQDLVP